MMFYNVEAAVFQRTLGRTCGCEAKSQAPGAPPPPKLFCFFVSDGGEKKNLLLQLNMRKTIITVSAEIKQSSGTRVSADLKSSADTVNKVYIRNHNLIVAIK